MTTQPTPGINRFWYPSPPLSARTITNGTTIIADADGEGVHLVGGIYWADRASHTVSSAGGKIDWLTAASTSFVVVSSLQIGIQDVLTTGPITAGDGTFDVSKTLVAGVDTISASTAYSTAMDTGSKTIAHGDMIAVVFKLSLTSGATSIRTAHMADSTAGILSGGVLETPAGTYNAATAIPNIVITADDGTLGFFMDGFPYSALNQAQNYHNASATKEYGNYISLPYPVVIDGLWAYMAPSTNAADYSLVIYTDPLAAAAGPTSVASISFDANRGVVGVNAVKILWQPLATPYTLPANTPVVVAAKPDTGTNIDTIYSSVAVAAHLGGHPLGSGCYRVSRNTIGAGTAFAATNSSKDRMMIGFSAYSFDDATGGSGGLIRHPGMAGGLNA